MNRYAVIMAGGAGLRLWPLSRRQKPKQFISVDGDECMIVQTIRRIFGAVVPDHCYIITNENLLEVTRKTTEGLIPLSNIITEPIRRNTAACMAYAAAAIQEKRGPGVMCFVPADGYVKDTDGYRKAVLKAFETAEDTGRLVVIGIVPTYPATGYGYIRVDKDPGVSVSKVFEFTEKPEAATAKSMLESGEYLWNGGILVGKTDVIIKNVETYLPGHFRLLTAAIRHLDEPDYPERIREAYSQLADISFDYGVLEKAQGLYAVKGNFDWDDIGSLDALTRTLKRDESGNATWGPHFGLDTRDSVIYSEGIFIATMGIDHMVVAATKDALIICPRDRAQEVKALVERLGPGGFDGFL
jgi:mannose-1-phosphate guanylyltransferase